MGIETDNSKNDTYLANIDKDPKNNLMNIEIEDDKENTSKKDVEYVEKDKETVEEEKELEGSIEESIKEIIENKNNTPYNFLINASNQANLTNTYNTSHMQMNALFVLVSPYYIEKFDLEGLDLNINFNENGTITLDNKEFSAIEIKPGIKVFSISKQK